VAFRSPGQSRPASGRPVVLPRWPARLIPWALGIVAAIVLVAVLAGIWTDYLWFRSIGYTRVFAGTYGPKWALFGVAAFLMSAVVGTSVWLAYRFRPAHLPPSPRQQALEAYRLAVDSRRRLLLAALLGLIGLISGLTAAGRWQTWLLFANRTSFGTKDPQFHLDISFFVFDYPFIRMALSYLFAAVLLALLLSAATHYLYGGLRPQLRGERATPAARAQLYVLAGFFVLLKAVAYWVDRYGIDFSQRGIVQTGASYTDVNAILPAKTVLTVIALICAVLFFAGAARRSSMLPAIGFGLLVLSAILVGGVYPAIIQQFVVKPNELVKETPYLSREIASTRAAYGVSAAQVIPYSGAPDQSPSQLAADAAAVPDVRLADPGVLSLTFQQLQQVKSYYAFPPVLGVDRYADRGSPVPQDMVVGVRAITGPPAGQDNWVNTHLVYTHGYGLVAAAASSAQPNGNPSFTEGNISPLRGSLGSYQPRVYFGEQEAGYVIVDTRQQELDYPNASTGGQHDNTYHGGGGVPVGSVLDRLLYAVKFRQLNILLSSAIGSHSKIIYIRDPLARVAKVAPFLTLDGDPYPVVADGQIYWVVDGYTTTDDYPYSQRLDAQQATASTYFPGGSVAGPGGQLNYLRNSVKALVNAYTGQVTLYHWGGRDPILAAWMKAFPGVIRPIGQMPAALRAHLRYPEVLFSLQRQVLTQFHVTQAAAFYSGQNFWAVPPDPSTESGSALSQPPYYLTMTMPGEAKPEFSVVTSFTQRGRPNMAAFLTVNSNPLSSGYGKIEILQLPQNTSIPGPQQANNSFQSYPPASIELTQLRKGGSKVTLGNLITLPLGGGLLYTQPVYVSAEQASGSYPQLKYVFSYWDGQVGWATTLQASLAQVLGGAPSAQAPGGLTGTVQSYLQQAEADYARAQADLKAGNLGAFQAELASMKKALDNASRAAGSGAGP